MPGQLAAKVPTNNATLLAEIYGSISVIAELAPNDPVRLGALAAYEETMKRLCIAATCVAVVPIVVCFFFTKDYYLGDYQNAHDGKTLDGKDTGFGEVNGVDATRVARVERQ
jgi:H+/gluconate symporter-like permease